jgi:hypothetical protein
MANVKGTILLPLVKSLRAAKDDARPLLEPPLDRYLEERVLLTSWYPEEDHLHLMRALGKLMGLSSYQPMGVALAQFELGGVYKAHLHEGDVFRTMRGFSRFWPLNHDTGEVEVTERKGGGTVTLSGFALVAGEICQVISGYIEEAVRMSIHADAQVTHVRCRANNAPRCVWEVDLPLLGVLSWGGRLRAGRFRTMLARVVALLSVAVGVSLVFAACSSSDDDGAPVAVVPKTIEEACRDLALAQCEHNRTCGDPTLISDAAVQECAKVEGPRTSCEAIAALPGSGYTTVALERCASAIRSGRCGGGPANDDCVFKGTKAEGTPCSYGAQCASATCSAMPGSSACGTCVPTTYVHLGDACDAGSTCIDSLCKDGKCQARSKLGEACDGLKYASPCIEGSCIGGTCTKDALEGESCQTASCDRSKGLTCDDSGSAPTCRKIVGVATGGSCPDSLHWCEYGAWCSQGTCKAKQPDGAPCEPKNVGGECLSMFCVQAATCGAFPLLQFPVCGD